MKKRILSMVLALVLLLGAVPLTNQTASAAYSLTYQGYTLKPTSLTSTNNANLSVDSITDITIPTWKRDGNKVTVKLRLTGSGCNTALQEYTFDEVSCTDALSKNLTMQNSQKSITLKITISRGAKAHSGSATCSVAANCTTCGTSYTAPHDYGDYQNDGIYHWQACKNCTAETEKVACSGGTATCKAKATCSTCKKEYGNLREHDFSEYLYAGVFKGIPSHRVKCTQCSTYKDNGVYYYVCKYNGTPNCSQSVFCTKCGHEYEALDNHDWGEWKSNGGGTHTRTCSRNSNHTETASCSGDSKANCTVSGTCTACGGSYKNSQNHSYKYTANGNVITESCGNGCGHSATATLKTDGGASLTYTGSEIKPLKVELSEGWAGSKDLSVTYSNNINAGSASGSVTFGGVTAKQSFEIAKATISVTATGYSGDYDGKAHGITVTIPDGATITYDADGKIYRETNPTYTDVGTHTVHYQVKLNDNYEEKTGYETVTISQATNTWEVEPSMSGWTYGEAASTPTMGTPTFGDEVKAEYKAAGASEYSTAVPTNAGSYVARFSVEGNANYTALSKEIEFVIAQATISVTATGYSGDYDGKAHGITVSAPDGATITYIDKNSNRSAVSPTYTDVGIYTVYYEVELNGNYEKKYGYETVTISQATNEWDVQPSISGWTYGETASVPNMGTSTFSDEVKAEYKAASASEYSTAVPTQAGSYVARFSVGGNANYTALSKEISFEIAKAKITVKANDNQKTYGESDPKLTWSITSGALVGSDTLSAIAVSRESGENAKTYVIAAAQTADANPNYDITFETGKFTINKATNVWTSEPAISGWTYKDKANTPTAAAKFGSVNVTYAGVEYSGNAYSASEAPKNAGEYKAIFTVEGNDNYTSLEKSVDFTIAKADRAAPSKFAAAAETIDGKADGEILGVKTSMEYRKDGDTAYTAITDTKLVDLEDGTYYIRFKETDNYKPSKDVAVTVMSGRKLKAAVPETQVGYTVSVDKTELVWNDSMTVTFALKDGYSKVDGFAVKIDGKPTELDENGKYTETKIQGDITVTVEGVADITAPNAEITIGESKWNKFWNNITFGLFFKDTQKVTITSEDKGSGADKIYYHLSETELTEEDVKALAADEWTEYTDAFNLNPQDRYIVYAKATDKDGNVAYINSDGVTGDDVPPAITVIDDAQENCNVVILTVSDKYLDYVTVDGEKVELLNGRCTVEGGDGEHIVVAVDKAGNTTSVTVTTKDHHYCIAQCTECGHQDPDACWLIKFFRYVINWFTAFIKSCAEWIKGVFCACC